MFVSHRHHHHTHELELIRWLALIAVAAALSLLVASEAHGTLGEPATQPPPAPQSFRDVDALSLWPEMKIRQTVDPAGAVNRLTCQLPRVYRSW